jgi:putative redox protein
MPTPRRLTFPTRAGHELAAVLDLPDTAPRAYALFAHCFTCSKDIKAAHWIGKTLSEAGIALLRFDFTGIGGSGGSFETSTLSTNIDDVVAAADFLRAEHRAPSLLIGHSLGGVAAMAAANDIPEIQAVATVATPYDPAHMRRYLEPIPSGSPEPERYAIQVAGHKFELLREFVDDLERQDPAQIIGTLGKPLLLFHSPTDRVVEAEQAARIFRAARHPKSFIALDGAEHVLSRREDAHFVAQLIATWSGRYL